METYIKSTDEQTQNFLALQLDGPIRMLNLIKFKPDGGLEMYAKYGENTAPVLERVGGKMIFQAFGRATVIGGEEWDLMFIIEFPNKEAFFEMVTSEEFQAGSHLRTGAILDSRLICMQSPGE